MMRFKNPTPGIWKIKVHNELFIQGEYNIWLPTAGLISENTFFLRPDPNTIITEPGNTAGAITVAAYNHRNNSIYIHSSRGYTRLGTIKPDLAAPGVNVVALDNRAETGTSIAAAHVAGAAANLLSWALRNETILTLNTSSAKSILIRVLEEIQTLPIPTGNGDMECWISITHSYVYGSNCAFSYPLISIIGPPLFSR